jgi:hypothetical protein
MTAPLSLAGMAIGGAWWLVDFIGEKTRKDLPGFGAHMAIRINHVRAGQREYIFDLGSPGGVGAAFYISASNKFVFVVRDESGEPYPLEIPIGRGGFPIAHEAHFALEAGIDGQATVMRALLNGRIVAERTLPFAVHLEHYKVEEFTIGASNQQSQNGGFTIARLMLIRCAAGNKLMGNIADDMRRTFKLVD